MSSFFTQSWTDAAYVLGEFQLWLILLVGIALAERLVHLLKVVLGKRSGGGDS